MKPITICFAYYRNAGILREQISRFRAIDPELKKWLTLIIVDDGSALPQSDEKKLPALANPAWHEDIGFPFLLMRIDVNVRWNQDAARNLAVHHAKTEWLLLLDMDHIPPERTLARVVEGKHDSSKSYRFSRTTLNPNGHESPYKPHPNSWLMTKALFDRMGGYDERFAGHYGTDGEFKERLAAFAGEPILLKEHLIRIPRETIKDASTTTLQRERDGALKDMRKARNIVPGWQPIRLSFPWTRLA